MVEYVFPEVGADLHPVQVDPLVSSGWSLVILAMGLLALDLHQSSDHHRALQLAGGCVLVAAAVVDIVGFGRSGILAYPALLPHLVALMPAAVAARLPSSQLDQLYPVALLADSADPLAPVPTALVAVVHSLLSLDTRLAVAVCSSGTLSAAVPVLPAYYRRCATVVAARLTMVESAHQLGTPRAPCIRQVLPTEVHLQPVQPSQDHHLGNHVRDHHLGTLSCNHLGPRPLPQVLFGFWS